MSQLPVVIDGVGHFLAQKVIADDKRGAARQFNDAGTDGIANRRVKIW